MHEVTEVAVIGHRDLGALLLTELADESRRRSRRPDELHLGFALVGAAVAAELCADAINQEVVTNSHPPWAQTCPWPPPRRPRLSPDPA